MMSEQKLDKFTNVVCGSDAIERVISNNPATIIFWKDGTKTVVKCMKGDTYDLEKGIALAVIKHLLRSQYPQYKKFVQKELENEIW